MNVCAYVSHVNSLFPDRLCFTVSFSHEQIKGGQITTWLSKADNKA